jgi:hypothetical protein
MKAKKKGRRNKNEKEASIVMVVILRHTEGEAKSITYRLLQQRAAQTSFFNIIG